MRIVPVRWLWHSHGSRRIWPVGVSLAVVLAGAAAGYGGSPWPLFPPTALAVAEETGSGRIIYELARLDDDLTRWAKVPAVAEFREALTSFIPSEKLSVSRTRN